MTAFPNLESGPIALRGGWQSSVIAADGFGVLFCKVISQEILNRGWCPALACCGSPDNRPACKHSVSSILWYDKAKEKAPEIYHVCGSTFSKTVQCFFFVPPLPENCHIWW